MATVRRLKAILEAEDRTTPVLSRVATGIKTLGAVAAAVGLYQIGSALVNGLRASVQAAAEAEKVDTQLAVAIRNSGQAVSSVLPQLTAYATALQRATGYNDEAVKSGQALLISIGRLRGEGLERATKAALDFSAATGRDLNTAFLLMAKAAAGNTQELSRYGIVLGDDIEASEKFARVLDLIGQQFGGAAGARINTFSGQVELLRNNFDDLKEAIGNQVMPVLTAFLRDFLNPLINGVTDSVNSTTVLRDVLVDLARAFVPVLQGIEILAKNVQLLATIMRLAHGNIGETVLMLYALRGGFDTTTPHADAFRKSLEDIGNASADTTQQIIAATEALEETVTTLAKVDVTAQAAVSGIADVGFRAFEARLAGANEQVERLGYTLSRSFREGGVRAAQSVGDAIVDAAEQGEFSFRKFAASVLADFARIITQALIARAIIGAIGGVYSGGGGGGGAAAASIGGNLSVPSDAFIKSAGGGSVVTINAPLTIEGGVTGDVAIAKMFNTQVETIKRAVADLARRSPRYREAFR